MHSRYKKSKKILSVKVTDEHVHDSKMLPQLVEDITKSKNMAIDKVLADGVHMMVMMFLDVYQTMKLPCIKIRKNAKVRQKTNHVLRNMTVISQKNDLQK